MQILLIGILAPLCLMTFIIIHKLFDIHRGTSLIPESFIKKIDSLVHGKVIVSGRDFLLKYRAKFASFILVGLKTVRALCIIALHEIGQWTESTIDRLKRGKRKDSKGSVSFFLKHMAEYKSELQK